MTKRTVFAAFAVLVMFACIPVAFAQNFEAGAQDVLPDNTATPAGDVWIRYYVLGAPTALGEAGICGTTFADDGGNQRFCAGSYVSKKGSYRGPIDDLFNYGASAGTRAFSTFAFQQNGGTPSHVGYYAWNSNVILANGAETTTWFNPDCTGSAQQYSCAGPAELTDATGTDQLDVPNGPIQPFGSMRPIPVPRVASVTPNTAPATINLSWDAATEAGGSGDTADYVIWYAVDSNAGDGCSVPTDAQLTNQLTPAPISATSLAVDVANDLGIALGSEQCVTFSLQIEYENLGGNSSTAVRSRYKSANSQSVYLGSGGLAADIVNLQAQALGVSRRGFQVQVSWNTTLEDGVQGFYVARASAADGNFVRVSDLILANGQPSAYDFLDVVEKSRDLANGAGLFYRIETLDIDDSVSLAGPVTVTFSETGSSQGNRPMRRR